MSEENMKIVRRQSEVVEREGFERALKVALAEDILDENLEWVEDPAWPGAGTYHGLSALRSLLTERTESFDFEQHTERLIDAGDDVVSFIRWRGRAHSSGAEAEMRLATVTTLRTGKIIRVRFYLDRAEALKAVGLEE